MTDPTTPTALTVDVLTDEQKQRAKALDLARACLVARAGFSSGAADPIDLVNVASWITTGIDPHTAPEERAESQAYLDKLADFIGPHRQTPVTIHNVGDLGGKDK